MTTKYVQDIRKIVGIDINQSGLGNATIKPRLGSRRGIASFNSDKQTISSQTGTQGQTTSQDLNTGDLTDPFAEFGNYINPSDPSGGAYDYDNGTFEADDDLFDTLPGLHDDSGNGIGGNDNGNGGTLNGISGLIDPETGLALDLRFDGIARPPIDWLNSQTPGNEYERWELGVYWLAPGSPSTTAGTPIAAATTTKNAVFPDYTTLLSATFELFAHAGGSVRWVFVFERPSDNDTVSFYAQDQSCSMTPDSACTIFNPVTYQPNERMQLILGSGVWEVDPREAPEDVIPSYTDNQHSRIDAEFGTARTLSIIPTATGGFIIGETATLGGAMLNNDNILVNSYGKVIDYVAGDMIDSYLPR